MGGVDSGGSAGESPEPRPPRSVWAGWKMPNPATTGLPNPASYDISEPDVVTDLVTGLMWQREAGPNDHYDAAVSYCDGLTLGGYTDWRLPTRIELVSLLDFTRTAPAFDPVFGSHEGPYLTSSPYPGRTDAVYMIYFGPGYTTIADKAVASPGAVRCVR